MELYKVAKVNFKNRPESFKKEFKELVNKIENPNNGELENER